MLTFTRRVLLLKVLGIVENTESILLQRHPSSSTCSVYSINTKDLSFVSHLKDSYHIVAYVCEGSNLHGLQVLSIPTEQLMYVYHRVVFKRFVIETMVFRLLFLRSLDVPQASDFEQNGYWFSCNLTLISLGYFCQKLHVLRILVTQKFGKIYL